jgi:hypothetical protein
MKRARLAALLAGSLAIVALAGLATWETARPAAIPPRVAEVTTPAEGPPLAGPNAPPRAPDPPPAPPSDVHPVGYEAPPPQPTVAVEGKVEVREPDSDEPHAHESGSLSFVLDTAGLHRDVDVEVRDGAWRLEAPVGSIATVRDAVLGRRPAMPADSAEAFEAKADAVVEISLRWARRLMLHVRAADTRVELADVDVVTHWRPEPWQHPDVTESRTTAERGHISPIDLSELTPPRDVRGRVSFFARSPGFAWGRIDVNRADGGDVDLELRPGGDVEVVVSGDADLAEAIVRLHPADAAPHVTDAFARLHGARACMLESVDAIRWSASVESRAGGSVLGSAPVAVVAGGHARVVIDVTPLAASTGVRLTGVVRIPAAWSARGPNIDGTPIEPDGPRLAREAAGRRLEAAPEGGGDRRLATFAPGQFDGQFAVVPFEIEGVTPGRVALTLDDPSAGLVVDVGPNGRDDVVLDVPPPVSVSLRVVDSETGEDAAVRQVLWKSATATSEAAEGASRNPDGTFSFEAPLGEIRVRPGTWDYAVPWQTLLVAPGHEKLVLRIARTLDVRVRALDGETPLPWQWSWRVELRPLDGGEVGPAGWDASGARLSVTRPGRYRLALANIEGYRAVPEQEIDVAAGRANECVVRLERE